MTPRRYEFEVSAAPVKGPAGPQAEDTGQTTVRAAPDTKRDEPQGEPLEEPGYGHGV